MYLGTTQMPPQWTALRLPLATASCHVMSSETTSADQIDRCKGGICWEELKDTYEGVERDVLSMREGGRVIAVENKETHKYVT